MIILLIIVVIILLLVVIVVLYTRRAKFGSRPSGNRLAKMKQSPRYKDGKFQNTHLTPQLAEGYTMPGILYEYLFKRKPKRRPIDTIPSVKTDLLNLNPADNMQVWFGHSSYFMQVDGKKILVDPVFSGNASPLSGTNKAFKGSDIYGVDDMPFIDYLFISHDHYDHLDYETVSALKGKVNKLICGLGVGAHLEHWGYTTDQIVEKDWNELVELDPGFTVHTTPARHFSGRGFSRNNTLWLSFVLQTPAMKIFIGGDSGYDTHFAEIGNQFGPFDLAILENGQYNLAWRYIHALPEEVLQAALDLKAKRLFPVHSGKFMMANHAWDEPLQRISALSNNYPFSIITPMIGEAVDLSNNNQSFKQWWLDIK